MQYTPDSTKQCFSLHRSCVANCINEEKKCGEKWHFKQKKQASTSNCEASISGIQRVFVKLRDSGEMSLNVSYVIK